MALIDDLGQTLEKMPGGSVVLTSFDALLDWSRGHSLWSQPMGTACCAMELIASSFSKFDLDRHGTFPRADPRSVDVMVVAGTISRKMAPAVLRVWEQMAEPRWCIAMGNCTVSGGIFHYDTYAVMPGVDSFLPVDVYIAGCPPRPEALQDAILQLRDKIRNESVAGGRTYEHKLLLPTSSPRVAIEDRGESA